MTMTEADLTGITRTTNGRRHFSKAFKQRITTQYDNAKPGDKGKILRTYGLYSSHIKNWRNEQDTPDMAKPTRNKKATAKKTAAKKTAARAAAKKTTTKKTPAKKSAVKKTAKPTLAEQLAAEKAKTKALEKQLAKTEKKLHNTGQMLTIMGKAHALLEDISKSADTKPKPGKSS